jgi:hypothetical protein
LRRILSLRADAEPGTAAESGSRRKLAGGGGFRQLSGNENNSRMTSGVAVEDVAVQDANLSDDRAGSLDLGE